MPISRRRSGSIVPDAWPGWVDALSSLLMVVIFLLLLFVVAQVTLASRLTTSDAESRKLSQRLKEQQQLLTLEQGSNDSLRQKLTAANDRLRTNTDAQSSAADQLAQLLAQTEALRAQLAGAQAEKNASVQTAADRASALQQAEAEQNALRLSLSQSQAQSAGAEAQVVDLAKQMEALRTQLAQVQAALQTSEATTTTQAAKIDDLGTQLSAALASKVQELTRYRSEFFGKLREVLGARDDIRVVGDRFVFQSEVLFPSGSADLEDGGREQLTRLAQTLVELSRSFPKDIDWVLRVDGHTDRVPITSGRYASNWELSTARAVEVVKFLNSQGVPANRLAATGFGEYQPLDSANTADAFARNRRIEFKLDQR